MIEPFGSGLGSTSEYLTSVGPSNTCCGVIGVAGLPNLEYGVEGVWGVLLPSWASLDVTEDATEACVGTLKGGVKGWLTLRHFESDMSDVSFCSTDGDCSKRPSGQIDRQ